MTEDDVIKSSVQYVNEAAKRSRIAFLASTTASIMVFVAIYNTYFSWYSTVTADTVKDCAAARDLMTNWVRSHWINIGALGIQVGVADASVLGAAGLVVIGVWLFFSVRREHHTIIGLLKRTKEAPPETRQYVYYGVASSLIFVTTSRDDAPRDLDQTPSEATPFLSARLIINFLLFLPFLCVLLITMIDVYSLFQPATFRCSEARLWSVLTNQDKVRAAVMIAFSWVASYVLLANAVRIRQFDVKIRDAMSAYALNAAEIPDPPPDKRGGRRR